MTSLPPPSLGTTTAPSPPAGSADTARAAGRGGLAIAAAKVLFILFGFAQQIVLPRLLGVDGYGEVSRVLAWVAVLNNVVVASALQGVSHAVSSVPPGEADYALRRTLRIHFVVAALLSASFALAAGPLASFASAPQVETPLRLVAVVVFLYGLYAPLVGSLNGRRRFLEQAGLDIGYGVLRTFGMIGGAVVFLRSGGSGVVGCIAGFIGAAALILPIAMTRTGLGKPGGARPETASYLRFLVPLGFGQVFLNLLMQTDALLLSRFVGQAALAAGLASKAADSLVGVYRGVQLFAFLPYQMVMSVTFVLFPMLAQAGATGDKEAVRAYTKTGVRLALLITGLMCSAIAGMAPHVLRFAFPVEMWTQGASALRVLSLGMGAFSVLGIACSALSSLGKARASATLTALATGLVAVGCYVFVPGAPFGPDMLMRSALATSVALGLSAVAGGILVTRVAGSFVAPASLARILVALVAATAVGSQLPWIGKIGALFEAALVAATYTGVLVLLRELGKDDLGRIGAVVRRRK